MRPFLIPHSLCLLLTMGFSVSAHADPKVDATVMSVVSGGQWESNAGHGHYRVVVWQTGFEHVSTGALAEWIDDSGDPVTEARVVVTRELAAMGCTCSRRHGSSSGKVGFWSGSRDFIAMRTRPFPVVSSCFPMAW